MPKTEKKKLRRIGAFTAGLLVFMLFNQSLKLIDIFPSFIACFMLARRLTYYADRAPYFAECRDALIKLGFLNLMQIPAFIVAAMIRSGNVADNDTMVLFTFVFAVFECLLLINAIRFFFQGVFYMGMRGAVSAITPFKAVGGIKINPELLRDMAYILAVLKALGTALPEILLLTSSDITGAYQATYNNYLYARASMVVIPILFILGAILSHMFGRYLSAVTRDGELAEKTDAIIDGGRRTEIEKKRVSRDKKFILTLLSLAVVFSLDLRLSNFSMVDAVPNYITGIILFFALLLILKESKKTCITLFSAGIYTVCAFVSSSKDASFLENYGYAAIQWESKAKSAYESVITFSAIEFAALALMYILLVFTIISFLKNNTTLSSYAGRNDRFGRREYIKMNIKVCIFSVLGILNGLFKFLYVFFNNEITSSLVNTGGDVAVAVTGLVPWFGTFLALSWVFFLGYSLYLFGTLKEEIDLKYS